MSKITSDALTRSGTGCFTAVPMWQQWASKGQSCSHVVIKEQYFKETIITSLWLFFVVVARQCPADMVWTECVSACGSTCEALAITGSAGSCFLTATDCLPGCQCRQGTVFDRSVGDSGRCVAPADCNCRYKGSVYSSGSTVNVDCNEWSVRLYDLEW